MRDSALFSVMHLADIACCGFRKVLGILVAVRTKRGSVSIFSLVSCVSDVRFQFKLDKHTHLHISCRKLLLVSSKSNRQLMFALSALIALVVVCRAAADAASLNEIRINC